MLQWLKEGDENTIFFYVMANGHKNRNFIPNIRHNGVLIANLSDIGKVFTGCFQQQFGYRRDSRLKVDFQKLLEYKLHVDLSHLERPFSFEEIECIVFNLGGNKAPGRMVFRFIFLSNSGIRSSPIFCGFVRTFISGEPILKRINQASISLIPKFGNHESMSDCCLINLINFSLKILSNFWQTA